jgi:uncharacterized protein (DUF2147 family)
MARQRIKPQDETTAPAQAGGEAPAAPEGQAEPEAGKPSTGRKRLATAPAGEAPPKTAAEAVAANPGAASAAQALADELDGKGKPPPPLPFATYPKPSEHLAGIVNSVIDSGEGVDLVKEFEDLIKLLEVKEALTPQVVRAHINRVESCAHRAHRLFVLTKAQFETYRTHAETALGAMRDAAIAALSVDKAAGKHAKQITDRDVEDRAATMFPDAWSDISDRIKRSKLTLDNLERFADLWQRRSWSLSELNK